MRFDLILGGIVLLCCVLPIKMFFERGTFQRLALAFAFIWGAFAALHFWGVSRDTAMGILPLSDEALLDIAGLWIAYAVCCLPGVVVTKAVMKAYETTFPPLVDRVLSWGASAVLIALLAVFLLMTASLHSERTRSALWQSGAAGLAISQASRAPVSIYLKIASLCSDTTPDRLQRARLPDRAMRDLGFAPRRAARRR